MTEHSVTGSYLHLSSYTWKMFSKYPNSPTDILLVISPTTTTTILLRKQMVHSSISPTKTIQKTQSDRTCVVQVVSVLWFTNAPSPEQFQMFGIALFILLGDREGVITSNTQALLLVLCSRTIYSARDWTRLATYKSNHRSPCTTSQASKWLTIEVKKHSGFNLRLHLHHMIFHCCFCRKLLCSRYILGRKAVSK